MYWMNIEETMKKTVRRTRRYQSPDDWCDRDHIYIVDAKQMQPASIVITLSNLQALGSPKTQL